MNKEKKRKEKSKGKRKRTEKKKRVIRKRQTLSSNARFILSLH